MEPDPISLDAIRERREQRRQAMGMPDGLNRFQQIAWMLQRNLDELKRQGRLLEALRARDKRGG